MPSAFATASVIVPLVTSPAPPGAGHSTGHDPLVATPAGTIGQSPSGRESVTTIPEVVMYSLVRIARLNVVVSPAKNSGAEVVFTIPTSRIVTVVLADTPIAVVVPSATEPP